jgi:hypothetical protein
MGDSSSASQETSNHLWDSKVHYLIHKNRKFLTVTILS